MKRIILIFGAISGLLLSGMMVLSIYLHRRDIINYDNALIFGYSTMVLAFLLVFFGVRAYRENAGGTVSFGRAFLVGLGIVAIACVFYVVTWEIVYFNFVPDYLEKWTAHEIAKMKTEGATAAAIQAKQQEMAKIMVWYRNPILMGLMTFIEPFPVGLLASLISAGVLRRKSLPPAPALA